MHVQAVKPVAAEGGDQAGMNVQNPMVVGVNHVFRQNGEEPCQHHQLNGVLLQQGQQPLPVQGRVFALFLSQDAAFNAGGLRPLKGIGLGSGGNHQGKVHVRQLPGGLGIDDGLQIGASAGYQHGHVYHSTTPFSPATISPSR